MEFYVDYCSSFDNHSYETEKIKKAIQNGGGKNVHLENKFGWEKEPVVVCFEAPEDKMPDIKAELQKSVGTHGIIISNKELYWD